MPTYILRGVDPELWRQVKSRAVLEGRTLREVITALLRAYAEGPPDRA